MITKNSSYKEIMELISKQDHPFCIDPCGTLYIRINEEYELYGTPNFRESGELTFELYKDELIVKDLYTIEFDELSIEDLIQKFEEAKNKAIKLFDI